MVRTLVSSGRESGLAEKEIGGALEATVASLKEGVLRLGRFNVSKIVQWEDVIDRRGRVMVSSWPPGGDKFEVKWV